MKSTAVNGDRATAAAAPQIEGLDRDQLLGVYRTMLL
jgi:hypothetical protein